MTANQGITSRVIDELAERGLGFPCHVTVKAAHGVVTLSGRIRWARQQMLAARITSGVWGDQSVVDLLTIW